MSLRRTRILLLDIQFRPMAWRKSLGFLFAGAAIALAGCAEVPADPSARTAFERENDPVEPTNRAIFETNFFFDRNAFKPVATVYRDYVPDPVQNGLHNLLANLQGPVIEINDILQGNPRRGWVTFQRFMVNTTVGGLGLFDVAADWGLPFHDADYGQTLAVWGIADGPYVVLPLFGPSSVRDAVGIGLGFVLDPFAFVGGANAMYAGYARGATNAVDDRAANIDTLDELQKNSIDFYSKLRSVYRQHRAYAVSEAKGEDEGTLRDSTTGSVTLSAPEMTDPDAP
jgi:phospholipid-binding lipoprotein MlaA